MMRRRTFAALFIVLAGLACAATLSLEEALRTGLQGNPGLRVQDLSGEIAHARIAQARAAFLPTLRGAAGATHAWKKPIEGGTPQGYDWSAEAGLVLSQTLYSAQARTAVALARRELELERLDARSRREELILQLGTLYWDIVWMQEDRASLNGSHANLERIARTVQAQLENGIARRSDLGGASLAIRNVEASMDLLDRQIASRKNALLLAMGKEPDSTLVLTDSLVSDTAPDTLTESVAASTLLLHGRIRAKELEEEFAADARRPVVTAFAKYGTRGNSDRFDLHSRPGERFTADGALGLQLEVPLLDAGASGSARGIARLERRQLELEEARQELSRRSGILDARKDLETARRQVSRQRESLAMTSETFRMKEEEHRQQIASLADLLRAESEVIAARSSLAEARYRETLARLELERALGLLERRAR